MKTFSLSVIDSCFQGLVGACGISVLCSLMRVYHFTQAHSHHENGANQQRLSPSGSPLTSKWRTALQFWYLVIVLSLVGSRVSSLIVLEFTLRAASAWASAGLDKHGRSLNLLLVQCQFSLGCSLTCSLDFLHQGALHSSMSLLLATALSWTLASVFHSLWVHAAKLYQLHSTERNCGKCITLVNSGHAVLALLQRLVILTFAVGVVASTATLFDHFLSHKDALKFWTPLTLCYTALLFYTQEEQNQQTGPEALVHCVILRLGALLVLMLTVGEWSDVLHVLIALLGEAGCLLPSKDLLQSVLKEEEDEVLR